MGMERGAYLLAAALAGLLGCGGGGGGTVSSQPQTVQGAFQYGPSIGAPRAGLTATLLPDGSVLLAGGRDGSGQTWTTAFRYSPASGTIQPTGSLGADREGHAACLLADGRVLVCGGDSSTGGSGSVLNSAEIYNPSTGLFSPAAAMPRPRYGYRALLLPDGQVMVAGGSIAFDSYELGTFIYDPVKDAWHAGGDLSDTRFDPLMLTLQDGRILIAGGLDFVGHVLGTADLFDPVDESVHATGKLGVPRAGASGSVLPNGKALLVGGVSPYDYGATPSAELFDPATAQFAPAASPQFLHFDNPSALLPDGRILFAGSWNGNTPSLRSELYDPVKGKFARTGDGQLTGTQAQAVPTPDGKVLILGGSPATQQTERFDPKLTATVQ